MAEVEIKLEDLQGSRVFVVGEDTRYRLQPSMKVGEFTLFQIPQPITPADMADLKTWVDEQSAVEEVQFDAAPVTFTPSPSPKGQGESRTKKK